jgi:hypothetical protein
MDIINRGTLPAENRFAPDPSGYTAHRSAKRGESKAPAPGRQVLTRYLVALTVTVFATMSTTGRSGMAVRP